MRVNGILSFFLFVIFVVLIVDQFVERGDGPFELQKQDCLLFADLVPRVFLRTLEETKDSGKIRLRANSDWVL